MTAPATDRMWIAGFLDALTAERGIAKNTRMGYARDLADAADWLAARGTDMARAGRADLEAYLAHCDAQGLATTTRARRLSALKGLFRFAREDGWRDDDPAIAIRGPAQGKRLPKSLGLDDVDRLLDAAAAHGRNLSERLRTACLMQVLYATGLRVSELVSLPVAAVRGDPDLILVRGKGDKDRMVPLSPPAKAALRAWLVHRDAAEDARVAERGGKPSPFLFPSTGKSGHLTRVRFYTLIKDIARAAGVPADRVTPHAMRHAFATHLLHNGADLRAIQTLLGHADIATTEIYTHILDERLKTLVLEKHPLAKPR